MKMDELHLTPIMITGWESSIVVDDNHIELNNVTMQAAIDKKNVEIKAASLVITIK